MLPCLSLPFPPSDLPDSPTEYWAIFHCYSVIVVNIRLYFNYFNSVFPRYWAISVTRRDATSPSWPVVAPPSAPSAPPPAQRAPSMSPSPFSRLQCLRASLPPSGGTPKPLVFRQRGRALQGPASRSSPRHAPSRQRRRPGALLRCCRRTRDAIEGRIPPQKGPKASENRGAEAGAPRRPAGRGLSLRAPAPPPGLGRSGGTIRDRSRPPAMPSERSLPPRGGSRSKRRKSADDARAAPPPPGRASAARSSRRPLCHPPSILTRTLRASSRLRRQGPWR